jgi:hypothetical protein
MPTGLIDSALPRGSELPAAPARPASEDTRQPSCEIIPGDDPGDQQPPRSTLCHQGSHNVLRVRVRGPMVGGADRFGKLATS